MLKGAMRLQVDDLVSCLSCYCCYCWCLRSVRRQQQRLVVARFQGFQASSVEGLLVDPVCPSKKALDRAEHGALASGLFQMLLVCAAPADGSLAAAFGLSKVPPPTEQPFLTAGLEAPLLAFAMVPQAS